MTDSSGGLARALRHYALARNRPLLELRPEVFYERFRIVKRTRPPTEQRTGELFRTGTAMKHAGLQSVAEKCRVPST